METTSKKNLLTDFDVSHISETHGFVLEDPLTNLSEYYRAWMDVANNLTHLIESRKLRDLVDKMPVLSIHHLSSHRELRLAHLVLGYITMGYVWQEGKFAPAQILPKALALPLWLVSRRLDIPPILIYADVILANWKLRDPTGKIEPENIDVMFSFPGDESSRGFFLVSLLVEKAASSGIMGALEVMHAIEISDLIGIQKGLEKVSHSLKKMKETFKLIHEHVDPAMFHGTLRIFISGWRDNPMLPRGMIYEGVSDEPVFLSGISAAQSSSIQCFDALLCIQHEDEPGKFLKRMRDYMPPAHRQLIENLSLSPSLRDFILSQSSSDLCKAYNSSVSALLGLRNYHLSSVVKYIVAPGDKVKATGCPLSGIGTMLNNTGTGGSNLMGFLKSIRDNTKKVLLLGEASVAREIEK